MMQSLLIIVLVAGMFLFPTAAAALNEKPLASEQEQIIAPSEVRQGDFALRLAQAFNLPISEYEEEATRALAILGIQPAAGWAADQPMTPQIEAELRDTVVAAAASGRLVMGLDAAMRAFTDLVAEFELPLPAAPAPGYTSGGTPSTAYGPDCNGTALDYYYSNYGTPLYSYCPPPPAYYYMYYWVPCDFYWHQYAFTGFFIRKHFDGIPRARHGEHGHRFQDGHVGKQRDHEHPPHWRVLQADSTVQPKAISAPGVGSRETRGIDRSTPSNRVRIIERPFSNEAHHPRQLSPSIPAGSIGDHDSVARRWVAPAAFGNASAAPPTGRAHIVLPPHKVSGRVAARIDATPASVPTVAVPHARRSVNLQTPGWGSSVSRGASR